MNFTQRKPLGGDDPIFGRILWSEKQKNTLWCAETADIFLTSDYIWTGYSDLGHTWAARKVI